MIDHIVVYDLDGRNAGYLLWMLEYAGATNVSYLVNGIEGRHEAGYHVTDEEPDVEETAFKGKINNAIFADDKLVTKSLNDKNTVIVDTRVIHQAKGIVKHKLADRAGKIPGSINLPISAFYMDNGALKKPEELLWMLEQYGITPDKTIITSCNSGQFAGGAYPILRWLGFDNVKVHDPSWINWCKTN